jgi:hypothetical protein
VEERFDTPEVSSKLAGLRRLHKRAHPKHLPPIERTSAEQPRLTPADLAKSYMSRSLGPAEKAWLLVVVMAVDAPLCNRIF